MTKMLFHILFLQQFQSYRRVLFYKIVTPLLFHTQHIWNVRILLAHFEYKHGAITERSHELQQSPSLSLLPAVFCGG